MTGRVRPFRLLGILLLGLTLSLSASPAKAAEGGEVTLEEIVSNTILGHATDGYYLSVGPKSIELPRIMLARTAEGTLTIDAYGSTKSLLKNGPYGLKAHGEGEGHGHGGPVTEAAKIKEAIEAKEHLHRSVARTSGTIVADFSISRHLVFVLISMLVVLGIFITLAQRYKEERDRPKAPKGIFQNMMEVMVVFVRDEIAKPNIQGEKWRTFLPYLLTAFFFILVANILGLVPLLGAATSNIAVTGVMAVMTLVIVLLYSSKDHYKELLTGPPDAPIFVRVIMVPIEIIGLVMRHIALAVRLFANMMGGALIIFSLLGLIFIMNVLFGSLPVWGGVINTVTPLISIGFTVFILLVKLLVAFIQAYVFTILSALFIGMAVEEHHHGEESGEEGGHSGAEADGLPQERLDAVEEKMEESVQPTTV